MNTSIKLAQESDVPHILQMLRREGPRHAYAIQDLTAWFQESKFYYSSLGDRISYVLVTGHPAARGGYKTLVADGEALVVSQLLDAAGINEPCLIRETPSFLTTTFLTKYPNSKVYQEQSMQVTKTSYIPCHQGKARLVTMNDVVAVAQFHGAPPQAAEKFKGWVAGAKAFFGVFDEDKLISMGSSMVAVPEAWNIVGIRTRNEFRGKGYATEVVSAIVERAFQETDTVTLTVLKDNQSALRTYEKVGFKFFEDRVWIDNGTGAVP